MRSCCHIKSNFVTPADIFLPKITKLFVQCSKNWMKLNFFQVSFSLQIFLWIRKSTLVNAAHIFATTRKQFIPRNRKSFMESYFLEIFFSRFSSVQIGCNFDHMLEVFVNSEAFSLKPGANNKK